jgi:hypothetical protein
VRARLLLALASFGLCRAQLSSSVWLSNGVELQISTKLGDPTGVEQLSLQMVRASGNSFYRILRDQNQLAVFAYELMIDLNSDGTAVQAVAKPAEYEFASRFPDVNGGKPVPSLSSDHPLGPLASGQSATLGLFEIPGMGLQVSDTLRVKMNQDGGGAGAIRFSGLKVYVNRSLISGASPPASVTGRYAMFYLPGRGGFFFAAEPVVSRAFLAVGIVEKNHMTFMIDNVNYDCTADAPFLTRMDNGQLWVYHDPNYRPAGNWTQDPRADSSGAPQFFTAASDSLNWWLPESAAH